MSVLRVGQGSPVTLFPPGQGCSTAETRVWGDGVVGTQVFFEYERSGQVDQIRHLRRQADRDAAEVVALADEHRATGAVGVSRGARPSWARWRMTPVCSTGWCWSCPRRLVGRPLHRAWCRMRATRCRR